MKPKGKIRWRIVALLFFATTINYIDRQVIGILKPFIAEDLGWSEADYGYIVTAFQIAYAIGLLVTGKFLDKFGTRIGYIIAIVVWSIAGIFHAAARGVVGFSIARFFLGMGEAANFPAAVKTVAEWFPKNERAIATGWFNSGSNIGAIVAPIIVSGITIGMGWEWAFIITGSLGFIWIFFWWFSYHEPKNHPKISKEEFEYIHSDIDDSHISIKWIDLFKYKQTVAICLSRFITDWVWWFFLFWAPDFLYRKHGVNIKEVILPLIVIYTAASFGGVIGGWISSRLINRGKSVDYARKTAILICALCVVPLVFLSSVQSLWAAVGIIALAAAAHQGWASNIFTVVSDIYPKKTVGSMVGISGFSGAVGGALAASSIGVVLESTGSYILIFLCAGLAYLGAWIILKLMIPKIKLIEIK